MDLGVRLKSYADHLLKVDVKMLEEAIGMIKKTSKMGGKVIIAGNGASAAIASHLTVDLTKTAGIRAINFNEPDLITCFANDYGYEHWVAKALEFYADPQDLVILISSSGKSPNMVNAAKKAKVLKLPLITFSGFRKDNTLNKMGKLNFWVDNSRYNIVETVHQAWLLVIVDKISEGKA